MPPTRILVLAAVIAGAFLPTLANAQQKGGIKAGGTFRGEIPRSAQPMNQRAYGFPTILGQGINLCHTLVPISLKAGQSLSVSAEVTGSGRRVSLALMDPTGRRIAKTDAITVKTAELVVDEVSTTGIYKIAVCSDQLGQFKLETSSNSQEGDDVDKDDIEALEAKITRLEQELAVTKARLKAAKAKRAAKSK